MTWKAALPMYNVSARMTRAYEALLDALLAQAGLGDAVELVREAPLPDFWRRPDMLLSQTCGYPYITSLAADAALLATPCFDVPGCHGSDYASVIVARAGARLSTLADARALVAAANDAQSNSGMNVLRHAVAPLARDGRFFSMVKWSGSHAASLRMVREGAADIAAIDCVTYAYLRQEDPASVAGLCVFAQSAPSPGLPFIGARAAPEDWLRRLQAALLAPDARLLATMAPLRIRRFRHCDAREYARIGQLEQQARDLAYPELA